MSLLPIKTAVFIGGCIDGHIARYAFKDNHAPSRWEACPEFDWSDTSAQAQLNIEIYERVFESDDVAIYRFPDQIDDAYVRYYRQNDKTTRYISENFLSEILLSIVNKTGDQ